VHQKIEDVQVVNKQCPADDANKEADSQDWIGVG
jgi:hypothetical protein